MSSGTAIRRPASLRLRIEALARAYEEERSALFACSQDKNVHPAIHRACEVEMECLGRVIDALDELLED